MGQKSRSKKQKQSQPNPALGRQADKQAVTTQVRQAQPSLVATSQGYQRTARESVKPGQGGLVHIPGSERGDMRRIGIVAGLAALILIALVVTDTQSSVLTEAGRSVASFMGF